MERKKNNSKEEIFIRRTSLRGRGGVLSGIKIMERRGKIVLSEEWKKDKALALKKLF